MYKKAKQHFKKVDPILYEAARSFELEERPDSDNLFRDIVWTITGQQLSSRAANTIFARFQDLFHGPIMPEAVLNLSDTALRASGLSSAKVRAIKNVARAADSDELNIIALAALPDAEFTTELTKIKGIGPWTAQMLLMFSLNRQDVFSLGDLGLRKGIVELYGFQKPPNEKRLAKIIAAWSPYRTYAARILWKVADKKTQRIGRTRPR